MRYFLCIAFLFFSPRVYTQVFPDEQYPVLFHDVQLSGIYTDSKTFPDCRPIVSPVKIDSLYLLEKNLEGFSLVDFLGTYFIRPIEPKDIEPDADENITEHINNLWDKLLRETYDTQSSLVPLPHPYIVPGGRFREVYYWDSYFTMLGLKEAGRYDIIRNMVDNFAFLIDTYGHIPNGNRTYYLSRSQPPFFSLMVELLAGIDGKSVYTKYLPQLEREYNFWMDGKESLEEKNDACRRVVRLDKGVFLNRYWDDNAQPRSEAYKEDLEIALRSPEHDSVDFRNIRAACESGWDFSSRWLNDGTNLETIETTKILPVDLNSLLYHLEQVLYKSYKIAGEEPDAKIYKTLARDRKKAFKKYFWRKKEGFFVDYHYVLEWQNLPITLVGIYPLYFKLASKYQAKKSALYIQNNFLSEGGVKTSQRATGEQWDAPNGWAPLQYLCIEGLSKYKQVELSHEIKKRWISLVEKQYAETGKLLEKYNVTDLNAEGGGGEYPTQDGFGWTNGVYLFLISNQE
ncbi:MAG: alpha,alpha-trehalase TreF [Bacteroidales bacterium]|nr:alpha,alpha-trehalase TreF [Bacteroidales bacterium]MBN2818088.1 alpha,alpha-trehalase TreF [Bacteroidales bacterium]